MLDKSAIFRDQFPTAIFFDEDHLQFLADYLLERKLITSDEKLLSTEKPGEGNMNFVRRIITDRQTFILKQARPWVEKYPHIKAPVDRQEVEATYYRYISNYPFFGAYAPQMILYDPENLIIVFEDLGEGSDFTFCYKKSQKFHEDQLNSLLKYLSYLHQVDWGDQQGHFLSNQGLKKLNHEHIFIFPYELENGFDLDNVQPGLQALAMNFKKNEPLKKKINLLGQRYLGSGPTLIHGDYYPGSWLQVNDDVKVIDPEFAFFGYAEFDIGVMTAHLLMSGMKFQDVKNALIRYEKRAEYDHELFMGFCGVEILRRVIGLAQLPLNLTLNEKASLLDLAEEFITSPKTHKLL